MLIHAFLLGILIFKGLTARRLCKSFGVKGLKMDPLTPELNPSAQRCLLRFLLGIFNFERAHCETSVQVVRR
jgi:hypothetical protein